MHADRAPASTPAPPAPQPRPCTSSCDARAAGAMMNEKTSVFVPLRSNAHAFVAGAGVASIRRRLKIASLLYDHIYVEAGAVTIFAGPDGATTWYSPNAEEQGRARFDTARARATASTRRFGIQMGQEAIPGVPSQGPWRPVVNSGTRIAWRGSLEPLTAELPQECGWITLAMPARVPPQRDQMASEWQRLDERNAVLAAEFPDHFVRTKIIEHANFDLATGVSARSAVSADQLHVQVMSARLEDQSGWSFQGYALPMLFPRVGDLSWETIAALRRENALNRFRQVLVEVEEEACGSHDLERDVHVTYTKRLAGSQAAVEGLGSLVRMSPIDLVIGATAGLVTAGLVSPIGPIVAAAGGTAVSTAVAYARLSRRRRRSAWIAMDVRLRDATS